MKKQLLLLVMMLLPLVASAGTVEIDGIYYNLVSKTKQAEVTENPNKYSGSVVIPESVTYESVNYSVTSIGVDAFYKCTGLISIIIPNSVTSIEWEAFYSCSSLTSITIPNSVMSIGGLAFDNCHNLTSVTIGSGVTSIGRDAFLYCSGLEKVIVSDIAAWCGIKFLNYASNPLYFAKHLYSDDNTEITNLIIPNNVIEIGDYTFQNCSSLTSVVIPNNVAGIGNSAFDGCNGLTSITIPNSVTSIGNSAFNGCNGLTFVTIGNSVTSIGRLAFIECTSLTSITIPNSVMSIGEAAFYGCSGLTSITIGNSVMSIGVDAFYKCTGLISIIIPNSVTSVGAGAFYGCSDLISVSIGNNIQNIGSLAFATCPNLTDVTCYAENIPSTASDAFNNSYIEYATLHVPSSSVNLYKSVEPWKDFNDIIKIDMPKHNLIYIVDGELYKEYEIEEGAEITPETEPMKEGYTFSGWSEIPKTMPAYDVTITGSFTKGAFKLTYMLDGVVYKTISYDYGDAITPEPAPVKEGYTFSGWSEIPETMPAHDVTVTGTFTINKYKLTYMVDGVEYKSYDVEYGATITPIAEPIKEGYTFSGWSEIPASMPAHDVTISGTFSINKYKLTYMIDDKVYKETMYEYGATIVPEPQPEGDYKTFEWVGLPQTMPAHDVVVNASYTITGIIEMLMSQQQNIRIYSPNGKRLNAPQKGVNIIRMTDGKLEKIVVK